MQLKLKVFLSTLFFGWLISAPVFSAITLTQVPVGMKKLSVDITLTWTGGAARVHLRASTVPGGNDLKNIQTALAHYDSLHLPSQLDAGTYSFKVNPDIPALYRNTDLRYGINYCILTDGITVSNEFIILIESSNAPILNSPSNAASIKDLTPTFSWTGDAPFFAVLISDEPFKISDSGTVTGVSAVWQIITPYNSARYGDPDPSGINTVPAPPLISGKTYNWLVLNNYGNNSASTSKVAPVPYSFVYSPAAPIASTILIEPSNNDTIPGSDQILFRWALVEGAVSYKLELLEENLVDGSQADISLWKATSTGGQIILDNATGLLRRYNYKWRVYAIGGNGSASISEKRKFFYGIDVGNISITLKNQDEQRVPYAAVKLNRLGGSSSAVFQSGSTDNNGQLTVNKAPLGSYEIRVENIDGYAPKIDTIVHSAISGSQKTIAITPVLGKLVGKITNTVNGTGILNAKVTVTNSNGSLVTTTTNSQGIYTIGLALGNWQVKAEASGYANSLPTSFSLNQNTSLQSIDLALTANAYTLSGTITNSFSHQGLFGATVYLTQNGDTRTKNTDGNGNFSFSVPQGSMGIRVSSAGFASPEQQTISIEGDKSVSIALDPNASILSGRCKDASGTALPGIVVQATPKSGSIRSVLSDKQGYYELSLPAGDWILTTNSKGYSSSSNHKFYLDISKTVQGIDFILEANQSLIAGRATINARGLAGVEVSSGNATTLTDNSGYYLLSVGTRSQTVSARKEGYLISKSYVISVNLGESINGIDFQASGSAGVIKGKIVAGGSAVVQAKVSATNQTTRQIFTQNSDESGNYFFSLPGGEYQISANKDAFIPEEKVSITINDGAVVLDANIRLLPNQAGIIGTVASGNLALSGCEIGYRNSQNAADNGKTVSDVQGSYAISLQAGLQYELTALCAGYQLFSQSTPVLIRAQNFVSDFNLSKAGAFYRGTLVSTLGKPIVGAKISAEKNGNLTEVATDFNGKYSLSLGAGLYSLTLAKSGYTGISRTVDLSLGENSALKNDTLNSSVGKLSGRVASNGTPILNAFISIVNTSGNGGGTVAKTDADGRFENDALATGTYNLSATTEGYAEYKISSLTINNGQLTSVEIPIQANLASLSGTVVLSAVGLGGVSVNANANGISKSVITGSDGKFTIDKLPSAVYSISANLTGYSSDKVWVNQSLSNTGSIADVNFSLKKNAGSLSGTVSGAAILAGIRISLVGNKGFRAYSTCDGAGNYVFPSLPADDYKLSVLASGYKLSGSDQNPLVSISAPQTYNPILVSALFELKGIITNQANQGIPSLPIELSSSLDKYKTSTGSDGSFAFTGLPAGSDFKLACKPPTSEFDATDTTFRIGLDADKSVRLDFHTISRQSILSGTVYLDDVLSEGVVIRVTGNSNNQTVVTQPNGSYKILGIAGSEKPISLSFTKAGAKSIDTSLILKLNESKSGFDFRLKTLKLQLTLALQQSESKNLGNAKVMVANGKSIDTLISGTDGKVVLKNVPANQALTIVTSVDKLVYDNQEVSVFLGETDSILPINLKIHNSKLTVTVKDQNGSLLDNANIILNEKNVGQTKQGQLLISHLGPGSYKLIAGKSSYKSNSEITLTMSGDTTLTVVVELVKVEGGVYGIVKDSTVDKGLTEITSRLLRHSIIKFNSGLDSIIDTVNLFGQYFATGLVNGRKYQISVTVPGYFRILDSIIATSQSQNKNLVLLPVPATILGKVSNSKKDVLVKISDAINGQAKFTASAYGGYYAFSGLQNGSDYFLQALDGKYSTSVVSLQAKGAIARRWDAGLDSLGGIAGFVKSGIGNSAFALMGALVSAKNLSTSVVTTVTTDTLGTFSLAGLVAGKYELKGERKGFAVSQSLSISVTQATFQTGVVLNLESTDAGIGGIVQDQNANPISAALKLLRGQDTLTETTDATGQFIFPGQPAGTYQLIADKKGYSFKTVVDIVYTGKGFLSQALTLTESKNSFSGIIRDAITNTPIAEATVISLDGVAASVNCDSLGHFEMTLPSLTKSPLVIEASQAGYITSSRIPVYLDSNNSAAQDISLSADYKFSGEITVIVKEGKDTLPGLFVTVQSFHPDDTLKFSLTGKAPNSFRDLRWPMNYSVKVKRDGFKDLTKIISLTSKINTQKLSLGYPTSQIKLFITSDGKKGKGVELALSGEKLSENIDTAGLYLSTAKLKPGSYEITVKDPETNLIPFDPYFINLGEDSIRTDSLRATFFQKPILDSIIDASFAVEVLRKDSLAPLPAVVCSLYYRLEGNLVWSGIKLDSTAQGFSGKIPALSRAGTYQYYSVLHSEFGARIMTITPTLTTHSYGPISYSNVQTPFKFNLRDPFLLYSIALLPQRLEADTSIYSLGAKDLFQVQMRGEKGRNLNNYFDQQVKQNAENNSISWKFGNPALAKQLGLSLSIDTATPRLCHFRGGNLPSDSIVAIVCTTKLGSVTLTKTSFLRIQDLFPASVGIKYVKENRELEADGASLSLSNLSTNGYLFSAFAKTAEGRIFNISPRWSFGADSAIGQLNQQGLLIPDSAVARSGVLSIYDTLTVGLANNGSPLKKVFNFNTNILTYIQVIPASKGNTVVSNGEGTQLKFNLAGLSKAFTVSVSKPQVSGLLRSSPQQEVVGEILDIELSEKQPFKADSGAVLTMPVSNGIARQRSVFLGHWNSAKLSWEKVDSTKKDSVVNGKVYSFSKYAVLMGSLPLGAYDFTFAPNPFSSQDPWGLQLSYKVSSDVSSQVGVSVEVFNMMGDKVYQSEEVQLSKGDVVKPGIKKAGLLSSDRLSALGPYVWDGHDSQGRPCRNGRYLIKLTVKDGQGSKSYLKKVVMLK